MFGLLLLLLAHGASGGHIHPASQVKLPEKASLKSIHNAYIYAGTLYPAADVMELNLKWSVNATRTAYFAKQIVRNAGLIANRFVGAPEDIRDLIQERLAYIVSRINSSAVQEQNALKELSEADTRRRLEQKGEVDIRSFFSNAFMFLLGIQDQAMSARVDKMAGGLAQTSKEVLVNRDHIKELANMTNTLGTDFSTIIQAEQVTDDLSHEANKEIYEHRQGVLFYRALARGELKLELLPSAQYEFIQNHLDRVTASYGVRTVKKDILDAPHHVRLEGDDLKISLYVAVYPNNVRTMEAYHPLPGLFSYEGKMFKTDKPEEALIAVSEDGHLNVDMTLEEYGACHRDQASIICFGQRVLNKVVKSCSMARYLKNLEDTIRLCNLNPLPEDAAFWVYDTKSLSFLSKKHQAPEVNRTCGNTTTTYHVEHLALETGCKYETRDLLVYGKSRLTSDLHIDVPFQHQFKPSRLPLFHQRRLQMLEFDSFRGYDQHDFDGWDLFHHVGTIVLIAVVTIVLAGVVAVGLYLWKKEKTPFKLLEEAAEVCGHEMHPPGHTTQDESMAEGGGRVATATQTPPTSKKICRGQKEQNDKKRLLPEDSDFTDSF